MKLFQKEKTGDCRIITILGVKIFSYKKKRKIKLQIIDKGENNRIIQCDFNGYKKQNNAHLSFIFNGNNNSVYISKNIMAVFEHDYNYGNVRFIFNGNNSIVKIDENTLLNNSTFDIRNNVTFSIGKNCSITSTLAILSNDGKISIGDNFCNSSTMQIFAGGGKNMDLTIGNDCMFSREIVIYTHDGHGIFDRDSNEVINTPKNSVIIGNNVWLGHGTHILKNSILPNNTVVGAKSVVTKAFEEENTIIVGNPANVRKRNIYWKK